MAIVVGIDGSPDSDRALTAAAELAERTQHDLVVVHVTHLPALVAADPVGAGMVVNALDDSVDHCHMSCELALAATNVPWAFEVRHGDPAAELLQAGEDHDAACIVVGRHGHRRLTRVLLGSVTNRLVLHADRTVLVVPRHCP
jgi:nucleotide-binding universal stress UspA family protein